MGERAFTKLYYGLEASDGQGTAVAADTQLVGITVPEVPADRIVRRPEEDLGLRAASMRSWIGQYLYQNTLSFEDSYFQLLPVLFSIGVKGGVSASEQNSGEGDYAWDFTPSLTATNTPDSLTVEFGDDAQAYEVEYLMAERLMVSGTINQGAEASPVSVEADVFGRQIAATSFTGAISPPTATEINAKLARFYLDTAWSGVGGTEKTGLLREFSIEILTGLHPKFHGDQNQYFNTHGQGKFAVRGEFTFEGNSDADAIWDAYRASTFNVVRLSISGAQIGSGDNHNLTLDIGGTWEDVIPLGGEESGNNLHTAVLVAHYDTTGSKLFDVDVTTDVSAI